jgi:hypothetical protein
LPGSVRRPSTKLRKLALPPPETELSPSPKMAAASWRNRPRTAERIPEKPVRSIPEREAGDPVRWG